jgi:hypothetical protein
MVMLIILFRMEVVVLYFNDECHLIDSTRSYKAS